MTIRKHLFENYCIDFSSILEEANLGKIMRMVREQAKTKEAKIRVDFVNYKEYGEDEWAPMYFGLFVEWFAQHFLNYFGYLFNIGNVEMLNVVGSTEEDHGTDGHAITLNDKRHSHIKSIIASRGCPVYIQVKGTLNIKKKFQTNDGSRLPNFLMNALSTAVKNGRAYQARYILFTTGAGLHYRLEKSSNHIMEVIDYKKISKLFNGNVLFLNELRKQVKLPVKEIKSVPIDREAKYNFDTDQ